MQYTAKDIREHQKAMQEFDAKAREKAASEAADVIVKDIYDAISHNPYVKYYHYDIETDCVIRKEGLGNANKLISVKYIEDLRIMMENAGFSFKWSRDKNRGNGNVDIYWE